MHQTIGKLFGFRSAASSRPRPSRISPRGAFRPTLDHLETRDVPSASMLQPTLAGQAPAVGQINPIAMTEQQTVLQPVKPVENDRPVAPAPLSGTAPNVNSGPALAGQGSVLASNTSPSKEEEAFKHEMRKLRLEALIERAEQYRQECDDTYWFSAAHAQAVKLLQWTQEVIDEKLGRSP
jgi:hypothetical protein